MIQMHLGAQRTGATGFACGNCGRLRASRACTSFTTQGRRYNRSIFTVRAQKKQEKGLLESQSHRSRAAQPSHCLTQPFAAAEDDRSDLQQLGQKASDAFNKAAGSVKDAFEEIDDNVLEYCSLDAKVPILSVTTLPVQCLLLTIVQMTVKLHHCNIWHAGWQAHVQDDSWREGGRISGSFERKPTCSTPSEIGCC